MPEQDPQLLAGARALAKLFRHSIQIVGTQGVFQREEDFQTARVFVEALSAGELEIGRRSQGATTVEPAPKGGPSLNAGASPIHEAAGPEPAAAGPSLAELEQGPMAPASSGTDIAAAFDDDED